MNFFAFQCQVQFLPIYAELTYPTKRRANKVVARAILIDFFFYLTVASAGYWSMFNTTPVIVLERKSKDNAKDIPGVIGIVGVVVCIFVAFPCSWNPTRSQICMLIWGTEEFSKQKNVVITSIFVAFTWFVAYIYPKVD